MINGNKISVLAAFVCNPYLAVMFKKCYLRFWKDEVDEVLINVNGRNKKITKFIVDLWKDDDKVKFIDTADKEMRQGQAFDRLFPKVTGDILVTIDSDNYIYKKGVIEKYVKKILNKEFTSVGSRGHHAYPGEVMEECMCKYGNVRLNPFMSFWKMDLVKKIKDITFETYNYEKHEEFGPLGKMKEKGWMDVMAKFSLQYFEQSPSYMIIDPTTEGEYVHFYGISSIFRRSFQSLEDTNSQKFDGKDGGSQHINYWVRYWLLYKETWMDVPVWFNEEYVKGFHAQLKVANIPIEYVERDAIEFSNKHKGLFK